ncbi:MAG: MFS transporter [Calditrichia bacterium]
MARKQNIFWNKNLQIIYGVTLMSVLGVSSITPAFPKIVDVLHISANSIGLLITAFTLPGFLLTPVLGVFADRVGRKKILVPSLLLFGGAGFVCGFARDFHLLLLFRFLQGIGGASLGSLNVTLIGDLFTGKTRTSAMGINASILSVGTASYPFIGGALATIAWYFPFFLPVFALPIGFIVLFSLNNPEPEREQELKEYLASVWMSIKNRKVVGLFIASVVTFIMLYGSFLTYLPILLGQSFNASPIVIGIILSSMSVSTALTSAQLGNLSRRISKGKLIMLAFLFYAAGLFILPFVHNIWWFFLPTIIFGLGHGVNIPAIQTMFAELAPMKYRGAFMSLNGMVLRFGQTIGPPLMGLIYAMWGVEATFFAGAAFAVVTFFLIIALIVYQPAKAQDI